MNTSDKSKRKFEKFINSSSREKNRNKENKLNISNISKDNNSYNSTEKRKYKYEYSNSKINDININVIKNDDEEKNILLGLIKEGLISIDELNENEIFNINNIKLKEIDLEKIMKKIIFLNKSLKSTQAEKNRLKNEEYTFVNSINKKNNIKSNNNTDKKGKNVNIFINKDIYSKNNPDILKKYEDDLKYFTELINDNNKYDEFKKNN